MTQPGDQMTDAEATDPLLGRLLPWLPRLVALAAGLIPLAVLYYIFWARISYPLDLEWMESGMLMHAKQVAEGRSIYRAPTVDFASFCYPPLYPWLLGWLGKIFGLSYTLGRALSVLAVTTTLALAAARQHAASQPALPLDSAPGAGRLQAAWKRLRAWLWADRPDQDAAALAVLALGAVAVAYGWTGAWYDLVRNDSLFVALTAGGLYALTKAGRRWQGVVVAGSLLGLAFFAKQTAVFFIVAAGLGQAVIRLRWLPVLVAVVGVVAGLGTLLYNHVTDGWFWFYVFDLHQAHQTTADEIWTKAPALLWEQMGWLYLGALAATLLLIFGAVLRGRLPRSGILWLLAGGAGFASAAVGKGTQWSFDNAYIPGVVFPAACFAVVAAEAMALLKNPPAENPPADPAPQGWRARVLGQTKVLRIVGWLPALLVTGQIWASGLPDTKKVVPDRRAWQQAERLIKTLRQLGRQGEVYVPYHPWYSVIAGGPGHGHIMNVNDVNYTKRLPKEAETQKTLYLFGTHADRRHRILAARRGLMRSIRQALTQGRFRFLIHDRPVAFWRPSGPRAVLRPNWSYAAQLPGLTRTFRPEWELIWDHASPRTLSGNPTAPRYLWQRPGPSRPPRGGRVIFDFEQPGFAGWRVTGTAFGTGPVEGPLWDPRRNRAQGLVAGAGGRRWVSSFHGGDAATGTLQSPAFLLDRPRLSFKLSGGRDPTRLVVRLRLAGAEGATGPALRQATGRGSERFRTVRWDVRPWQGKRVILEVEDRATGGWGHLQLDDVWLVP